MPALESSVRTSPLAGLALATLLATVAAGCTTFDATYQAPAGEDANPPDAPRPPTPDASATPDAPSDVPDAAVADAAPADAMPADAAPGPDGQVPDCWNDPRYSIEDPDTGHRFWVYDVFSALSWESASTTCAMDGAYLPVIETAEENDFVRGLIPLGAIWTGLNDRAVEGTFEWMNGAPVGYENWAAGEPNAAAASHDCVEMYNSGEWNDTRCALFETNEFACECDPDYLP